MSERQVVGFGKVAIDHYFLPGWKIDESTLPPILNVTNIPMCITIPDIDYTQPDLKVDTPELIRLHKRASRIQRENIPIYSKVATAGGLGNFALTARSIDPEIEINAVDTATLEERVNTGKREEQAHHWTAISVLESDFRNASIEYHPIGEGLIRKNGILVDEQGNRIVLKQVTPERPLLTPEVLDSIDSIAPGAEYGFVNSTNDPGVINKKFQERFDPDKVIYVITKSLPSNVSRGLLYSESPVIMSIQDLNHLNGEWNLSDHTLNEYLGLIQELRKELQWYSLGGPKVITMGEHGSILFYNDTAEHFTLTDNHAKQIKDARISAMEDPNPEKRPNDNGMGDKFATMYRHSLHTLGRTAEEAVYDATIFVLGELTANHAKPDHNYFERRAA